MTHTCANLNCRMELQQPNPANLVRDREPSINDIIICGGCGCPNFIVLLGTREMTDEDLLTLSDEERHDIAFAIRAVKVQLRNN